MRPALNNELTSAAPGAGTYPRTATRGVTRESRMRFVARGAGGTRCRRRAHPRRCSRTRGERLTLLAPRPVLQQGNGHTTEHRGERGGLQAGRMQRMHLEVPLAQPAAGRAPPAVTLEAWSLARVDERPDGRDLAVEVADRPAMGAGCGTRPRSSRPGSGPSDPTAIRPFRYLRPLRSPAGRPGPRPRRTSARAPRGRSRPPRPVDRPRAPSRMDADQARGR
jgi:hypothetical protein